MTHVTVRERASLGDLTRVGVSVHIRFRPWESSLIGDVRSWSLIQTFGENFTCPLSLFPEKFQAWSPNTETPKDWRGPHPQG